MEPTETNVAIMVVSVLGVFAFLISFPFLWKKIDKLEQVFKSKVAIHIGLTIFDLISIGFIYLFYEAIRDLITALHGNAEVIKYTRGIGVFTCGFIMPIVHIIAIIEHCKPDFAERRKSFIGKGFIVTGISLIVAAIIFTYTTRSIVEKNGYHHCRQLESLSMFSFLVFTRDMQICKDQAEAEAQRSLSAR